MALSADTQPHFSTLAGFISSMSEEIPVLFRDVLLYCDLDREGTVRHRRVQNTLERWLDHNDDKPGKGGKPKKSNLTDNESAKMKSAHGVMMGWRWWMPSIRWWCMPRPSGKLKNMLLVPMIEGTRESFQGMGSDRDIFEDTKLTADAGYHTEANMKRLFEEGIDGYVADTLFRKRDPRFAEASRYKERHHREGREARRKSGGVLLGARRRISRKPLRVK